MSVFLYFIESEKLHSSREIAHFHVPIELSKFFGLDSLAISPSIGHNFFHFISNKMIISYEFAAASAGEEVANSRRECVKLNAWNIKNKNCCNILFNSFFQYSIKLLFSFHRKELAKFSNKQFILHYISKFQFLKIERKHQTQSAAFSKCKISIKNIDTPFHRPLMFHAFEVRV